MLMDIAYYVLLVTFLITLTYHNRKNIWGRKCPHCKNRVILKKLSNVTVGSYIFRVFRCPHCTTKFRVKLRKKRTITRRPR